MIIASLHNRLVRDVSAPKRAERDGVASSKIQTTYVCICMILLLLLPLLLLVIIIIIYKSLSCNTM